MDVERIFDVQTRSRKLGHHRQNREKRQGGEGGISGSIEKQGNGERSEGESPLHSYHLPFPCWNIVSSHLVLLKEKWEKKKEDEGERRWEEGGFVAGSDGEEGEEKRSGGGGCVGGWLEWKGPPTGNASGVEGAKRGEKGGVREEARETWRMMKRRRRLRGRAGPGEKVGAGR
ncbi:hypothetical protein AKJ39_05030 [candidate division MSBL1 archaeon SCGC-AAA259J03]|uniref:Uncharacterized protein n=1 Tax=candidate division MSBL1 archaeon SCGC-AAA259J03 TaxID=1698269 RepID=A0A656YVA1_9EURY|nr:hypothetical protein AKJ39_05030 [candidate division MSBL1 archaeon SCGC-AAA259J03]